MRPFLSGGLSPYCHLRASFGFTPVVRNAAAPKGAQNLTHKTHKTQTNKVLAVLLLLSSKTAKSSQLPSKYSYT